MLDRQPPAARPERRALRRARALVISLVAAVAIGLVAAQRAEAGSYVVTECSPTNPGYDATAERSTDRYRFRSYCNSAGDGLEVYHDAERSTVNQYGAWVWRAPAGTVFTSVRVNASLTYHAGHHGELVATTLGGAQLRFGSEHADFRVESVTGEFAQFHASLRCAATGTGGACGRADDDSAHAYVRGIFVRTDDRSAPTLRLTGGSILGGEVVRGSRSLTFDAADAGGGIRAVSVEANGATLAADARNCALLAGFATALRPCPPTASAAVTVATADPAFATGPNTITACVEDLALDGTPNRACRPTAIWVDNVCPGSTVGDGVRLTAGFGGEGAARGTSRSDEPALVRGRLEGSGAGAIVCALTRTLRDGAPITLAATAITRPSGEFALELPAGPSREVFVHYARANRVIARHGLLLRSIARPRLGVRPAAGLANHDRLHFSGKLPGPACADRVVKVQARIGRRRWQVFRTGRADADCRFAARYKLRATRDARNYRFRALVPQQQGYPYEPGHSRPVKVEVDGER